MRTGKMFELDQFPDPFPFDFIFTYVETKYSWLYHSFQGTLYDVYVSRWLEIFVHILFGLSLKIVLITCL